MNFSLQDIELFIIIFARTTAIMALFPIFGSQGIPLQVKVGASLFISILLHPIINSSYMVIPAQVFPFLMVIAKEVLVGLVIGFVASVLFVGIHIAGQLVGMQMGLAIANAIDPQTQQHVSLIAHFQTLLATMIFLTLNGHIFLLSGIKKSFEIVPIMGSVGSATLYQHIMSMGAAIFVTGVKIGAPIIVALLLTSVVLGIMAKVFPQMNVFFVGLPLKIGLGLWVLALSLPLFCYAFQHIYTQFRSDFSIVIRLLQ